MARTDPEPFRRDDATVLAYAGITFFAFWNYAYGPSLALLRDERHFSYTLLGVYTAAWSTGTVVTGLLFARVARLLSRRALVWCSATVATVGAAAFVLGPGVGVTVAGAVVLGIGGTTLLTALQAILSDGHGGRRDLALTEANIGAAASAVLAPLALSGLAAVSLGWRSAYALPVVGLVVLCLRYRRTALPRASTQDNSSRLGGLPATAWLFVGLGSASMGVEFCLVYFGAEQLSNTGLSTTGTVAAMTAHYAGLLAGRVGGATATRRPGRGPLVLYGSLAATAVGFLMFWVTSSAPIAVAGLLLAGLGVANLYPLAVALSLGAAPGLEDQANSRTQLFGGLLVIIAPFLLGALADHVGIRTAFTVEPVLIASCLILLVAGLRGTRTASSAPAGQKRSSVSA